MNTLIAARLGMFEILSLHPSPKIRTSAPGLLTKAYAAALESMTEALVAGETILLLTTECVRSLKQRPHAALNWFKGLMQGHGDMIVLVLKTQGAPQPVRLTDLIAAWERKIALQLTYKTAPDVLPAQRATNVTDRQGR